jgi:phage repressor protein C with HTH and peptisase S24 domain
MSEPSKIFFERLDKRRTEMGFSDRGLSLAAGASQDLIRSARNKKHIPNSRNLAKLAYALGVTTDWLLGRDGESVALPSDARLYEESVAYTPAKSLPDIPVLGTGHCGVIEFGDKDAPVRVEQTLFEPATVIRYVARPVALMGVQTAYAIYYVGESMLPRFQAGEMGIVDPRRPPARGDDVVVQLRADDSDEINCILVKRLLRQGPDYVELEQYNPAMIFRVPLHRVARIHRIVPAAEMLGG